MKKLLFLSLALLVAACQTVPPELLAQKEKLKVFSLSDRSTGSIAAASELNSQIIALEEKDPDSFIVLAKTLKKQGHNQEALELLQTGEKFNSDNEQLQLEVATALLLNDRPADTLAKLKTIKTLRTKEYYNLQGVAYDLTRDHKRARIAFDDGLKIAPDDDLLLNNKALSYILDKQPEEGIKILKELVKRPDAKPKYRQNLALAYGVIAKPEEAMKLLLKDLDKKQAEENLKYYKELRQQKK